MFHTVHAFIYLRVGERSDRSGLAAFEGKKVGYLKGILRLSKQLAAYPDIVAVPLESNEALAKGLLDGSLDAVLGAYDLEYWRASHGVLGFSPMRILLDLPSDMTIAVRKDWPDLAGILNKGLAAITPDEMAELYRRWFGSDYLQRVEDVRVPLTPDEQAWLAAHSRLTIGAVADQPPVVIVGVDGDRTGILVDYVKLLNRRLGTDIRIVVDAWPKILKQGTEHKLDLLGFVFPLEAHRPYFDFTRRVLNTYFSVYVREDEAQPPRMLADLVGKRVGYIGSTRIVEEVAGRQAKLNLASFENSSALAQGLLTGQVDAAIHNAAFDYWRKLHGETGFKISALLPEIGGDMVFGVRNDWPQLTAILNKGLASISEEEHVAILNRWLGGRIPLKPEAPAVALSNLEREWLSQHLHLRAGINPVWAPIEFADEKGAPVGVSVAYLKRLETLLGVRFELVASANWGQSLQGLEAGTLDVLPATTITADRRTRMHFTEPYLAFPTAIFSASEVAYLGGLKDLEGKSVAVIRAEAPQEWLRTDWPDLDVTAVTNTREALSKLTKGKFFAFVGNLATTSYYIGQSGLTQVKVAGETPYTYQLGMAVRQDWPILAGILQKGLDAIPQQERDSMYHEWISVQYKHGVDYTLLWQMTAVSALVLLVVLYWNRKLIREVGRRRQAEAALFMAKDAADRANRAKSEFLANTSHDLRTPLNSVLGFTQILQADGRLDDRQQQLALGIHRGAERLLGLVDELLDLAKIEADRIDLEPGEWDSRSLLREMVEMFRARAEAKGIRLTIEASPTLPERLWGDGKRLHQILANLLDNAIKYTERGAVTLRVEYGDGRLGLEVTDTGVGIPSGEIKTIFEPFERGGASGPRSPGTGLGLAIVHRLVERMGGTLSLDSAPGRGSCFQLSVPAAQMGDTGARPASAFPALSMASGAVGYRRTRGEGPLRILVVDDELENRQVLRGLLEALGFAVEEADNGRRGIEQAETWIPDLMFMDLRMPEMDGLAATRTLRKHPQLGAIPIVAVTAAAFAEDRATALAAGCDDHLPKPVIREALITTLGALLPLEWQLGEADTEDIALPPLEPLPPEQADGLVKLVASGSITALHEFVQTLERQGQCPVLARRIGILAEDFDLKGLRRLLAELRITAP